MIKYAQRMLLLAEVLKDTIERLLNFLYGRPSQWVQVQHSFNCRSDVFKGSVSSSTKD